VPDLFHGGQLVVMGRYAGKGPAALKLTGTVGQESREFVYETTFPEKTNDEKSFVEQVWARRKVGYMLDQIRLNGEKKELVEEVTLLAKKYGIATPYTSYLIVPDGPMPVVNRGGSGRPNVSFNAPGGQGGIGGGFGGYYATPPALEPKAEAPASAPQKVADFARQVQKKPGDVAEGRGKFEDDRLSKVPATASGANKDGNLRLLEATKDKKEAYDQAKQALERRRKEDVQAGK